MYDRIIMGFGVSMLLVWFGLEPRFLLTVDWIVFVFVHLLILSSHEDDHASIAKLPTVREIAGGSLMYLIIFFFGLIIRPQDDRVLQLVFPIAFMLALILTLALVYWFVLATLTIGEKISIWLERK